MGRKASTLASAAAAAVVAVGLFVVQPVGDLYAGPFPEEDCLGEVLTAYENYKIDISWESDPHVHVVPGGDLPDGGDWQHDHGTQTSDENDHENYVFGYAESHHDECENN